MFLCKVCQIGNDVYEFLTDQLQSFCHDDQVRVIAYIAGGRAQVNDALWPSGTAVRKRIRGT